MSCEERYRQQIGEILAEDSRYEAAAYDFVREAVSYTTGKVFSNQAAEDGKRHVTGPQLAEGVRELALKEFGPLAADVLERWGLRETEDIGNIVFNLVNKELLGASEEDSIQDFVDVYDFGEAFLKPFVEVGNPPENVPKIA